ncbi:MAG: hypothetical protein Sapg2KO_40250 [Saprospiraceae bacterium]
MNLKKLHYFAGITISIFVGLHLFNHFFSLFGANAHIELMNDFRIVYRNIIAETVLFFAIGIQIFSGIKLFIKKRGTTTDFFGKLQIWTGLYLAFFLVIHLSAVLFGRQVLKLDTNFYFGVAGLNTFPLNLFFIPYYGLAIVSFFGHISAIHSKKMKNAIIGLEPVKQSYIILAMGIISSIIILYGLTNGFNGVDIPPAYDVMIGK